MRLLKGEIVNRKTDWFNLTDAQLQLRPYTRPTMELAVAAARSPSGSVLAGKYGVGMLSIGGTSPMAMERHTANWGLYEETARENGHAPNRKDWRVVGMFHIAETRDQARKNVKFGVAGLRQLFPRRRDFSDHSGRCRRRNRVADRDRDRVHRHAGRRNRLYRAADQRFRRVWRALRAGAELGRLGCHQAALRADGALRSSAFPAEPRIVERQL